MKKVNLFAILFVLGLSINLVSIKKSFGMKEEHQGPRILSIGDLFYGPNDSFLLEDEFYEHHFCTFLNSFRGNRPAYELFLNHLQKIAKAIDENSWNLEYDSYEIEIKNKCYLENNKGMNSPLTKLFSEIFTYEVIKYFRCYTSNNISPELANELGATKVSNETFRKTLDNVPADFLINLRKRSATKLICMMVPLIDRVFYILP